MTVPSLRISAVICTYNRAPTLAFTLSKLRESARPDGAAVEVVLVDNNSTDDTAAVIRQFAESSAMPVKPVFERRQGLGHAHNAGLAAATGDIVCSLDDDIIVDRDYFVAVARAFARRDFRGVIGGRVELWDATDLPLTIKLDREEQKLTLGQQPSGFIHGCNMCFHRSVVERIGGFDRRFGPGTPLASADDTDFFYRALRAGIDVVYCPDIVVYHNHGRKTPDQAARLTAGYQIARGAFYAKHALAGDPRIRRALYWEYYGGVRTLLANPLDRAKAGRELRVLANYTRGAMRFIRTRNNAGPHPEAIA
jgi:GT2 family glycosyltransferase